MTQSKDGLSPFLELVRVHDDPSSSVFARGATRASLLRGWQQMLVDRMWGNTFRLGKLLRNAVYRGCPELNTMRTGDSLIGYE